MTRKRFIKGVAIELAAYIAKHPQHIHYEASAVRYRILALTGGGDGYSDHELDFLERAVRKLNRKGARADA